MSSYEMSDAIEFGFDPNDELVESGQCQGGKCDKCSSCNDCAKCQKTDKLDI